MHLCSPSFVVTRGYGLEFITNWIAISQNTDPQNTSPFFQRQSRGKPPVPSPSLAEDRRPLFPALLTAVNL